MCLGEKTSLAEMWALGERLPMLRCGPWGKDFTAAVGSSKAVSMAWHNSLNDLQWEAGVDPSVCALWFSPGYLE